VARTAPRDGALTRFAAESEIDLAIGVAIGGGCAMVFRRGFAHTGASRRAVGAAKEVS
jgi:hypothetical protein